MTSFDALAASWVDHLRSGGTTPWLDWLATVPGAEHRTPDAAGPRVRLAPLSPPGAAQLELLRRLNARDPSAGPRLADLVLYRPGPGRGMAELGLARPGAGPDLRGDRTFSRRPVDPLAIPARELVRVGTGVLLDLVLGLPGPTDPSGLRGPAGPAAMAGSGGSVRLTGLAGAGASAGSRGSAGFARLTGLAGAGASAGPTGQWRFRGPRWRVPSYSLEGPPLTRAAVAAELAATGVPPRPRPTRGRHAVVVLARPLDIALGEAWSARVGGGAVTRWRPFVDRWAGRDRLPPGARTSALARHAAVAVGPSHVHVVVDGRPARLVASLLGLPRPQTVAPPVLTGHSATELLRSANRLLDVRLPADEARAARARLARLLALVQDEAAPTVPPEHRAWLQERAERLAESLRGSHYAVHGDPAALLPTDGSGARRTVLDVLLDAVLEAERRSHHGRPGADESEEGA